MYKIKLRKLGFKVTIIIDDYFPCYPEGEPIFGKSINLNELWVLSIEKAFAKLYGRYGTLSAGEPIHSLYDMTGLPVF